jgi:hypothetical protein
MTTAIDNPQTIDRGTAPLQAPEPRYVGLPSARVYSSLSIRTLRRFISEGLLRVYRPVPGRTLIDLGELDRLIQDAAGRPASRQRGPGQRAKTVADAA